MNNSSPNLKVKIPVAINYFFFGIAIAICCLIYIPTTHFLNIDENQVNELEKSVELEKSFVLFYHLQTTNQEFDFQSYLNEIFQDARPISKITS